MGNPVRRSIAIISLALISVACGGSFKSSRRGDVSSATAAIRAAEEVGAGENPTASLHLKYAKEQLEEGQRLLADEDERASMALLRSEADAELALALAREQDAKQRTKAVEVEVDEMRKEVGQ